MLFCYITFITLVKKNIFFICDFKWFFCCYRGCPKLNIFETQIVLWMKRFTLIYDFIFIYWWFLIHTIKILCTWMICGTKILLLLFYINWNESMNDTMLIFYLCLFYDFCKFVSIVLSQMIFYFDFFLFLGLTISAVIY